MENEYIDCKFKSNLINIKDLIDVNNQNINEIKLQKKVFNLALSMCDDTEVEDKEIMLKAKELGFETEIVDDKYYIHFNKVIPESIAHDILKKVNNLKQYMMNKIGDSIYDVAIYKYKVGSKYRLENVVNVTFSMVELQRVNHDILGVKINYHYEWLRKILNDLGYKCRIVKLDTRNYSENKVTITVYWVTK